MMRVDEMTRLVKNADGRWVWAMDVLNGSNDKERDRFLERLLGEDVAVLSHESAVVAPTTVHERVVYEDGGGTAWVLQYAWGFGTSDLPADCGRIEWIAIHEYEPGSDSDPCECGWKTRFKALASRIRAEVATSARLERTIGHDDATKWAMNHFRRSICEILYEYALSIAGDECDLPSLPQEGDGLTL